MRGRDSSASGLRTMVNEKAELLPFSRWMMKRLSPANSFWNSAQFLRRPAVIIGSFLSCSRPIAPLISIGRTL